MQQFKRTNIIKECWTLQELVASVNNVVKTMIKYRPQNTIDGIRNIWILKPGDDSLGRGIVLKNSLVDIIAKVNQAAKENVEYVVQKYIGTYHVHLMLNIIN